MQINLFPHIFVYNNFKRTCFADFQYDTTASIIRIINLTQLRNVFRILLKVEK